MTTLRQLSFSGGEISPSLAARVDTIKYATGLRKCRNFMVQKWGGVSSRPGTTFVAEVSDSTKRVRLIPFVFNASQTYIVEFGNQYIRFHRNGAQILESAKVITNITQASPATVSSTAHGFTNGQEIIIKNIVGMTQVNSRNFKVAGAAANSFSLQYMDGSNVNSTGFNAYVSGGTAERVYTISSPYLEADLSTLNFIQSGDIITLTHPTYAPRELKRFGDTNWTLPTIVFTPETPIPTGFISLGGGHVLFTKTHKYVVTAISSKGESLPSTPFFINGEPILSDNAYINLEANVSSPGVVIDSFNFYKEIGAGTDVYGFIKIVLAGSLDNVFFSTAGFGFPAQDAGLVADINSSPPIDKNPFLGTGNFPSTAAYFQQRLFYANSNNNPEQIQGSRISGFKNFTYHSLIQDDDPVVFTLAGRQVNAIRHMLDIGRFVLFTNAGEWSVNGDAAGIIRPAEINAKQGSYNGSSSLAPLVASSTAIYVQARNSVIRDLFFDFATDGYSGSDLTIFSAHLIEGFTLTDWAYQQIPHSIVWAIRNDGVLLGLTYIREHQLLGWHRHDFDGIAENVCVVPEGNEDVLYLTIKRVINGQAVRYIERMNTRFVDDILDFVGMDCALSYDGRNTNPALTMTLTGGTLWLYTETLTLTASAAFFTASDIGNASHLYIKDSGGTIIDIVRCQITAFTSTTQVSISPNKTVPVALRATATSNWAKAVDEIGGLWHIEGKLVSVFADGFVVASPNNSSYALKVVSGGSITLDKPYSVIHVGLPITCDIETLNIDTPTGETLVDKKKIIQKVSLHTDKSRGGFVGNSEPNGLDPLENLSEIKIRDDEGYDDPVGLRTGIMDVNIQPEWNSNGRVFIRQIDPLPLTILAISPAGMYPFRS
jgi:hypothetical protein